MKVLLVTDAFFPHGNANSGVIGNLALALAGRGCEILLLSVTGDPDDAGLREWRGLPTRQVCAPGLAPKEALAGDLRKAPLRAIRGILQKLGTRIWQHIDGDCMRLHQNPLTIQVLRRAIAQELREDAFDVCVPAFFPSEAVRAALQACGPAGVPVAVYQMDTYWNNDTLPREHGDARFAFERNAAQASAFILTTRQIAAINARREPELAHKLIPSEFPLIVRPAETPASRGDGRMHCVFLGRLYPDLRPPEKIVGIIAEALSRNVVFDFYGAMQELITDAPRFADAGERIALHGAVPSAEAEAARIAADVLVNIDNRSLLQVPSKIFEYMSTGKPIINFYFDQASPALSYLRRYPLCLNLQVDDPGAALALDGFLRKITGARLPFEEVERMFPECTPDYVAGQFLDTFDRFRAGERQNQPAQ